MRLVNSMLRRNPHSRTFLEAHIVFSTKFRHKVITHQISEFLQQTFNQIAKNLTINIKEMKIDVDHVHMMIEYPPIMSISQIIKRFKGASSRYVRQQFPQLTLFSHSPTSFWAVGYFATSVGEDAEERIHRYLLNHKTA